MPDVNSKKVKTATGAADKNSHAELLTSKSLPGMFPGPTSKPVKQNASAQKGKC